MHRNFKYTIKVKIHHIVISQILTTFSLFLYINPKLLQFPLSYFLPTKMEEGGCPRLRIAQILLLRPLLRIFVNVFQCANF